LRNRVAVVILNYNGRKWLEKFLPSVVSNSSNADVIVADNGSTDDSISFLTTNYPTIQTIVLDANYGFTGGYNRALFTLDYEYFVLLNSDIEVTENWLEAPVQLLDNQKDVAACQPKIKSYHRKEYFEHAGAAGGMLDKLGYPFCRGRIFMTAEKDELQYEDETEIFWASGACLFIRANLYKEFDGLQEEFFAHMEEIDLCWRLKSAGYKIKYTPKSTVFHVGGGTLSTSNPRKTFLNFRNGLALLWINLPSKYLLPLILFRLILDGVAGVQFLLLGYWKDSFAVIKAHFSFYSKFGAWIRKRKKASAQTKQNAYQDTFEKSIVWNYFVRKIDNYRELLKA
jgi:GT2 family glycosyltransferase